MSRGVKKTTYFAIKLRHIVVGVDLFMGVKDDKFIPYKWEMRGNRKVTHVGCKLYKTEEAARKKIIELNSYLWAVDSEFEVVPVVRERVAKNTKHRKLDYWQRETQHRW